MTTAHLHATQLPGVFEGEATFPVRGTFVVWLDVPARTVWCNGSRNPLTLDGDALLGTAPVEGYPYRVTFRRDGFGWAVEFGD